MSETNMTIDALWIVGCTGAVFLMQTGFCCLEAGMVRSKNSINVAIKNVVDLCISGLTFWLVGYGLMFGASASGLIGRTGFCIDPREPRTAAFMLFQLAFCGTVITIVSGAVAERMKFSGYVIASTLLSGLIYPVVGHWVWGGVASGTPSGWLERIGFIDFAGSGVVHAVGGCVALAAILVIGPRHGRFDQNGKAFNRHNLPMSSVGVLLLWAGWFGFNGGSALGFTDDVPHIMINTAMGAAGGGAAALFLSWVLTKRADICATQNGILAGLVSITASCHVLSVASAVLVGAIGSLIGMAAARFLEKRRIDDVVGVIPVHGFAGIWGLLSVALFGDPRGWNTGMTRVDQLSVQALGATVIACWAFGIGLLVLKLINRIHPLRVSEQDERVGLNVSEHGAVSEVAELLSQMEEHQHGDFEQPVTVTSESEVGQIAAQYNRVLAAIQADRAELVTANDEIVRSSERVVDMHSQLQDKVAELEEFNNAAVGRELRMIDLKQEINGLAEQLGEDPRYDVDFSEDFCPKTAAHGGPGNV